MKQHGKFLRVYVLVISTLVLLYNHLNDYQVNDECNCAAKHGVGAILCRMSHAVMSSISRISELHTILISKFPLIKNFNAKTFPAIETTHN